MPEQLVRGSGNLADQQLVARSDCQMIEKVVRVSARRLIWAVARPSGWLCDRE